MAFKCTITSLCTIQQFVKYNGLYGTCFFTVQWFIKYKLIFGTNLFIVHYGLMYGTMVHTVQVQRVMVCTKQVFVQYNDLYIVMVCTE